MNVKLLKVGDLAKRTGLTVRTLHHYDEIGLVQPSHHSESGHRLYSAGDIGRLQTVMSLRQLGFTLVEIGDCLKQPDFSPVEVIRKHAAHLREQIEQQQVLCERLEAIAEHFRTAETVSADEFIRAIEVMMMIENYYTPDQLETLRKRREAPGGDEATRQGTADWAKLMDDYKTEMERGTDPADPTVQALEQRRQALVNAFTGGDAGIETSLTKLWTEQGDKLASQFGYDPKVLDFLAKAKAAAEKS
jgi:DNA-binding transcriptional MerR regulator